MTDWAVVSIRFFVLFWIFCWFGTIWFEGFRLQFFLSGVFSLILALGFAIGEEEEERDKNE